MNKLSLIIILLFLFVPRIVLAEKAPRYISLAPATTEILFSLGLNKEIVGVSSYCDYPPEAKHKEKIGSFSDPNIEKIISLKPDIIFCAGLEQNPIVLKLRQLNFKVCVSDPKNLTELYVSINEIGKLTQREKEANAIIVRMKSAIEETILLTKNIDFDKHPKVFIEIWHDPLMTVGKNSFINELIEAAGGKNIASNINAAYTYISPEQILKRDPEIIILTYMSKEPPKEIFDKRPGWKNVAAIKAGRIYNDIDPNILLRPGPRLAEGVKALHKKFYP